MRIPFVAQAPETSPAEQPSATRRPTPARRRGRRGATSIEYAVMISFILLVVIAGIQTFGISVSKLFTADAAATAKAAAPPPTAP